MKNTTLSLSISFLLMVGAMSRLGWCDAPVNGLTEAEKRGGWELLFDGKTLDGWRNFRQDAVGKGWAVKDGAIARIDNGAGDIITKDQFKYFELSLEYRILKGGNSGLFFHVTEDEDNPGWTGPEIQILDNVDGSDPQKSGWLYQLYSPIKPEWAKKFEAQVGFKGIDVDDATRPAGEWNNLYLRIAPNQCEVAVNGVSYYYFKKGDAEWNERVAKSKFAKWPKFGKTETGHLCLQDHGNEVAFRNLKIRTLADDGGVHDPVDGTLALKAVLAYPDLKWDQWEGVDDDGKVKAQRPLVLTHAGDGSNRVFVASQIGMIHVFENDPKVTKSKMFLDLRDRVHDWAKDNEEGLLGMAMHPRYKDNGQLYVYYTSEAEPRMSIVSRFRVSRDDPDRADPSSEQIVMKIPQPFANHNGGSIAFGKDGFLYIALGDGGGRNDPLENGQNLESWMGCVLRIDVDKTDGDKNYAIPSDNPFLNRKNVPGEIFAYGFRNIWRMSVDRETGTIWCADVGQDLWEEVNILRRGGNYGWSVREATHNFGNSRRKIVDQPIEPVWEYDHQVGKSITGGFVYRGRKLPELSGAYLYADFISGRIWALWYDEKKEQVVKNMAIPTNGIPVFSFGEDEQGEVYYMIESASGQTIYRFERS